jgi:hypothetical protein
MFVLSSSIFRKLTFTVFPIGWFSIKIRIATIYLRKSNTKLSLWVNDWINIICASRGSIHNWRIAYLVNIFCYNPNDYKSDNRGETSPGLARLLRSPQSSSMSESRQLTASFPLDNPKCVVHKILQNFWFTRN